jgi:hypothetical protein
MEMDEIDGYIDIFFFPENGKIQLPASERIAV